MLYLVLLLLILLSKPSNSLTNPRFFYVAKDVNGTSTGKLPDQQSFGETEKLAAQDLSGSFIRTLNIARRVDIREAAAVTKGTFRLDISGDDGDCIPLGMFDTWFFIVFLAEDYKYHRALAHIDQKFQELMSEQGKLKVMLSEVENNMADEREFIRLAIQSLNSSMFNLNQAIQDQEEAKKRLAGEMNSIFTPGYAIILILISVFLSVSINHIIYLMFRHREYHPL